MNLHMVFVVCRGVAGGALLWADSAHANDFYSVQTWRAAEPCAVVARDAAGSPGPVRGPDTCMRYGGHVRVEFGARAPGGLERGAGAAPATMRIDAGPRPGEVDQELPPLNDTGISRTHLRLHEDTTGTIAR